MRLALLNARAMRVSLFASLCAALLLSGCGRSHDLPDGGRDRINCTDDFSFVPVVVRDTNGQPVKDATVTASNAGSGKVAEGVTNDQGVSTVVTQDLLSGTISVRATAGTKQSNEGQIELVCGDCSCTGEPDELVLTIAL